MLIRYEGKNQWKIYDCFKDFVSRDVIFNESKFQFKDLFKSRLKSIGILLANYINIAKLFLPIIVSACYMIDQYSAQ